MGCYKVLSTPMSNHVPNYKGLYRSEPFPRSEKNIQLLDLWKKYVQYIEPFTHMGITTELTIDELKYLADLATQDTGDCYEVIYFCEHKECPLQAEYYGIDVTGVGGYSIVGGNFFIDSKDYIDNGIYNLYDVINQHFRARLNSYGLFSVMEDAISFRTVLKELDSLSPGIIEKEDWQILHIFKVT